MTEATMRLYLNGTEVGSVGESGSISRDGIAPVNLGRALTARTTLSGAIDDVRIYSSALTAAEVAALAGRRRPRAPTPANQPPSVSLTAPASGATFTAPASITLTATASDTDGTIARVDFYAGSTLLGTDSTAPYSFSWTNVVAGSYSLTAVARDSGGASTVSSTRDITVKSPTLPSTAVFTPSSNDATAVDRYVLEVFPLGADTRVANPVATQDLGKPPISNGSCSADVTSTILALTPGTYVATVTGDGPGRQHAERAVAPVHEIARVRRSGVEAGLQTRLGDLETCLGEFLSSRLTRRVTNDYYEQKLGTPTQSDHAAIGISTQKLLQFAVASTLPSAD
jgi:hypothetical protein